MDRQWVGVGAIVCGIAVGCGAFGAHALKDSLSAESLAVWRTGAEYQLWHGLAIAICGLSGERGSARLFAAGVLLFSGSLYALALTDMRWLGAITPFGGLAFLGGWGLLAWCMLAKKKTGDWLPD